MSDPLDITRCHCRFSGSDYQSFLRKNLRGFYRRGEFADPAELAGVLRKFDQLEERSLLKNSASVRIGCFGKYFIKRYNFRSFLYALKRLFRPSRPCRCLKAARRLQKIGVATPEVLAAVRVSKFRLLPEVDFLLTAMLPPGSRSLTEVFEAPGEPDAALIHDLVRLLVRLHAGGFRHGDLNIRNIFLLPSEKNAPAEFALIDLDGARFGKVPLHRRQRRKELARLISSVLRSRRDRLGENPDFTALIRPYAAEYLRASGIELHDQQLEQRVRYLFHRMRRK